jgi:hypothetical protein
MQMATYHCSINIGYSNKTMPHLDYINREGKYNHRSDELVTTKSGNMPKWATNAREFWENIAVNDVRSYREIEFALPNELSVEDQIDIVERFIDEVIPNNPYSYAIHEVDSKIHGIKNPHVHIVFSERLNEKRIEDFSKEEYFKQKGRSRNGEIIGGASKDRSWAGNRSTSKYYEVRETVADVINEKYKENGINKEISAKSLKAQKQELYKSGKVEGQDLPDNVLPYIPRKTFHRYVNVMTKIINSATEEITGIPAIIEERISAERERILNRILEEKIADIDKTKEPTQEHRDYMFHVVSKEAQNLIRVAKNPVDFFVNKLIKTQQIHVPKGVEPPSELTRMLAYDTELKEQEKFLTNVKDKPLLFADLQLQHDALIKHEGELRSIPEEDDIMAVLSSMDREELSNYSRELDNANNRIYVAEHILRLPIKEQLHMVQQGSLMLRSIYEAYWTPEIQKEAQRKHDEAKAEQAKYAPRSIEVYQNALINKQNDNILKVQTEKLRSRYSLLKYQREKGEDTTALSSEIKEIQNRIDEIRKEYLTPAIEQQAKEQRDKRIEKYNKLEPFTTRYYVEQLINKASMGDYYMVKNTLVKLNRDVKKMLSSDDVKDAMTRRKDSVIAQRNQFLSEIKDRYSDIVSKCQQERGYELHRLKFAQLKIDSLMKTLTKQMTDEQLQAVPKKRDILIKQHNIKDKHTMLESVVNQTVLNRLKKIKIDAEKPDTYYKDQIINKASGGALFKYQKILKSKEYLRNYLLREGKPTTSVDNDILAMKQEIKTVYERYTPPNIKELVKQAKMTTVEQRKEKIKTTQKQLHKDINRRGVTSHTKAVGNHVLRELSNALKPTGYNQKMGQAHAFDRVDDHDWC